MTQRTIVIVSAGVSEPSSSRLLADRLAQKTIDLLAAKDVSANVRTIELRSLAVEIARATVTGVPGKGLREAIERLGGADAVIAATPVYKAGVAGLFTSFIDVLGNDLLIAKPVALTATGGSARHALVPDEQMRPLFAFMRTLTIPTAVYAASEDWSDRALGARIDRAAVELAALIASGVTGAIVQGAWHGYQHDFAGRARAEGADPEFGAIDFDSDLMRLATGGSSSPPTAENDNG
ncbi:CE1759 family FMN reductase [Amycolatopsis sp. cmx-11-12]|uniref:CE1759 family FMN reductase n=1 Tax=Amycolatopsis sp. cmx-11-12 TaxID=2785795 RepID=UPI003917FB72